MRLGIPTVLAVSLVAGLSVQAAPVQLSYTVTASDFRDSNSNPPPAPTSTLVTGSFSFTFDDSILSGQTGLTLDSVIGFDITRNDGQVIDFDTTNTLVRIEFLNPDTRRITFGGAVNGEQSMVGLTDPGDFRTAFDVSISNSYMVANILPPPGGFTFQTAVDPFYDAFNYSVVGQQVSPAAVPLPGAIVLLLSGLLTLRQAGNRR
ncbi:MAG: hypothetical protein AAF384_07615 [Pseudomonadota bacterium]